MRIVGLILAAIPIAVSGGTASAQDFVPRDPQNLTKNWTCGGGTRVEAVRSSTDWVKWLGKAPTRANWKIALCNYRGDAQRAKWLTRKQDFALAMLVPIVDPYTGFDEAADAADRAMFPAYAVTMLEAIMMRPGGRMTPPQQALRQALLPGVRDNREALPGIEQRARERNDPKQMQIAAEMHFDAGNVAKAFALYKAALAAGLNGADVDTAHAFFAMIAYREGDAKGAAGWFKKIAKGSPWADVALFWQALGRGVRD
ncbi:MAG: hypothetical protein V4808_05375 [Pseudomonadota bacterium]